MRVITEPTNENVLDQTKFKSFDELRTEKATKKISFKFRFEDRKTQILVFQLCWK